MTDKQALIRFGFSSFKASEIALDAKRGDRLALVWVEIAKAAKIYVEGRK